MKTAAIVATAFVVTLTVVPRAFADDPSQSVVVTSSGPSTVRLRVAAGSVFPCSSSSNAQLFDGTIAANQQVSLQTSANCICVEHTLGDFPDKNWSAPQTACRPVVCTGAGRSRVCRPLPDQTIRVAISS